MKDPCRKEMLMVACNRSHCILHTNYTCQLLEWTEQQGVVRVDMKTFLQYPLYYHCNGLFPSTYRVELSIVIVPPECTIGTLRFRC